MSEGEKIPEPRHGPTFSILIAAYNAEATLADTLESILAQTRGDWEAIIVDDGSSDSTAAVARDFAAKDRRIQVVSTPNGGTGRARNVAAQHASGPFLALLDADDLYLPEYLERMSLFIDAHPHFDIYSVDGYLLGADAKLVEDDLHPDSSIRSYTAEDLLVRNRIRVHNVLRRAVFDSVGGFDEDRRMAMEDYDFWLRALLRGARHLHNPERLKVYRVSETAKTADLLACNEADVFMFRRLIERGAVSGERLGMAQRSLKTLRRTCAFLPALSVRVELEARLAAGDLRAARSLYLRSWRAWVLPKYALGLPVMLVSPRLFTRLLAKNSASSGSGRPQ